MKKYITKIKEGVAFSITASLVFISFGIIYASLNSVEPGDMLTAEKWNELVGSVNSLNSEMENLKNENASLNSITPQGAVIAFNLSSCPSGWLPANGENGTPDLRGSFIRGLGGDENGRDEARELGSYQEDQFQGHEHTLDRSNTNFFNTGTTAGFRPGSKATNRIITDGTNGTPRYGSETRPKNIALIYCVKE